jgi:hypothetical protein
MIVNYYLKRLSALVLALLIAAPAAQAQLAAGTCTTTGSAVADLDVNNVRARLYNNGGLFWKGAGNVYNVPAVQPGQPLTPNAVFASGIWVGGEVDGQPRLAATDYGPWEFYPGPLQDNGRPVDASCTQYDRIWVVSKDDVRAFLADGATTPDLRDWPVGLGAPAFNDLDGDGDYEPDDGETEVAATDFNQTLNVSGGQLPLFPGNGSADQMAFTVYNDVAGPHGSTGSAPIGIEIRQLAFAFNLGGAIGNTTFYRYEIEYKGSSPLTNTYFGVWSDPDLGNASDDYVGSDTTLGLGIVYNGDDFDEGSDGYGAAPPALGYDFFQGPLVDAPGETFVDPDGTVHENQTRLGTSVFLYYNNATGPNGNPRANSTDWYNYLQGLWQDDLPMVNCGNGYPGSIAGLACENDAERTFFMWPGDPVGQEFWSEYNFDGAGTANTPSDRRFLISTGPFEFQPGSTQELVYGIVWARGDNNLNSVARLKADDAVAQSAFDANFELAQPPLAPIVSVTELDQEVILSWRYDDPFYIQNYEEFNPFSFEEVDGGEADRTYNFEAFEVFQYPTEEYNQDDAERIGVFDVVNGVARVFEPNAEGETVLVASYPDTEGLQFSLRRSGLTNYQEYYYAVRAVAYNPDTEILKTLASPVNRVVAMPAPEIITGRDVKNVYNANRDGADFLVTGAEFDGNIGQGQFTAEVINPGELRRADYEVNFYRYTAIGQYDSDEAQDTTTVVTYDLLRFDVDEDGNRVGDATRLLNGREVADRTGRALTQTATEQSFVFDGLEFKITGPDFGFTGFNVIANASGPIPTHPGAAHFQGFPTVDINGDGEDDDPTSAQQVGPARWLFYAGGGTGSYDSFLSRAIFSRGNNADFIGAGDYEMRFNSTGSIAHRRFQDNAPVPVPFELWYTGVATPDDPSDDVKLIPGILDYSNNTTTADGVYNLSTYDSPVSSLDNDPFTDWIYWYTPLDMTPGTAGYDKYANAGGALDLTQLDHELFARTVLAYWNGGTAPPYPQDLPEQGTIFRITTTKPNAVGDRLVIQVGDEFAPTASTDSALAVSRDQIGIVPNPYKGASAYETSNLSDVARFVNLPETATIRIFTLAGTLIRTIEKSGPARTLDWNLQTDAGLPIASGMYLIHIEMPDGEEKVIKFGVVKKRIQLDLL